MTPAQPAYRASSSPNDDDSAAAMTCGQVRTLLSQFANSALDARTQGLVETHLEGCPACLKELELLRAEDNLLFEALSELRPDPSFRARVGRLGDEVLHKAEHVANTLPEKGWAIFRWSIALLAVLHFAILTTFLEHPASGEGLKALGIAETGGASSDGWWEWIGAAFWNVLDARPLAYWINLLLFITTLFLLLGGRLLAEFEKRLARGLGGSTRESPTRLEVLTLEVIGLSGVLASSLYHFLQLTG